MKIQWHFAYADSQNKLKLSYDVIYMQLLIKIFCFKYFFYM